MRSSAILKEYCYAKSPWKSHGFPREMRLFLPFSVCLSLSYSRAFSIIKLTARVLGLHAVLIARGRGTIGIVVFTGINRKVYSSQASGVQPTQD